MEPYFYRYFRIWNL